MICKSRVGEPLGCENRHLRSGGIWTGTRASPSSELSVRPWTEETSSVSNRYLCFPLPGTVHRILSPETRRPEMSHRQGSEVNDQGHGD